jgi:formylglycine-generating enzyme required for sulfatase activity
LRGSSYVMDEDWLRCAVRIGNSPHYWHDNVGFRVCVSPLSKR